MGGSPGWGGPGNQRYLPLGRLKVRYNGAAGLVTDISSPLQSFPCPKIGDSNVKDGFVGYELVPVGDSVKEQWNSDVNGLYLDW